MARCRYCGDTCTAQFCSRGCYEATQWDTQQERDEVLVEDDEILASRLGAVRTGWQRSG